MSGSSCPVLPDLGREQLRARRQLTFLPSSPEKLTAKTNALLSNCVGLGEDHSALGFWVTGLEFAVVRAHLFSWVTRAQDLLSPDPSFSVCKKDVMMPGFPTALGPVCQLRGRNNL